MLEKEEIQEIIQQLQETLADCADEIDSRIELDDDDFPRVEEDYYKVNLVCALADAHDNLEKLKKYLNVETTSRQR